MDRKVWIVITEAKSGPATVQVFASEKDAEIEWLKSSSRYIIEAPYHPQSTDEERRADSMNEWVSSKVDRYS